MMPICDVICKGSSKVKLIFSDIIKWMCYQCLKYSANVTLKKTPTKTILPYIFFYSISYHLINHRIHIHKW